jgi:hypothetical protein
MPWLDVAFFHGASGTKKDSPAPTKEPKRRYALSQEDTEPQQSSQNGAGDADGAGAKTKAILKN